MIFNGDIEINKVDDLIIHENDNHDMVLVLSTDNYKNSLKLKFSAEQYRQLTDFILEYRAIEISR